MDVRATDHSECFGAGFWAREKGSKTQPEPVQMFTPPPEKEAQQTTFSDAEFIAWGMEWETVVKTKACIWL